MVGWDVGCHTRLLCWTASGTNGVISRESSCFVGAIVAALMSFLFPMLGFKRSSYGSRCSLRIMITGFLLILIGVAGILLFNGDGIDAPEDFLVEGWSTAAFGMKRRRLELAASF